MRSRRQRTPLGVEAMESRELLSGVLPTLTMTTYNAVIDDVRNVMGTLAKTHNFTAAANQLTNLSGNIPYGRQQLAPVWRNDLGIYNAQVPGSGLTMQNQILHDLNNDIVNGVHSGQVAVVGPGSAAFYQGTPTAPGGVGGGGGGATQYAAASVFIRNSTPYTLRVQVYVSGNPLNSQTQTIASGATSSLYNFGPYTYFLNANISNAAGPPPTSFNNANLTRPSFNGYFGATYAVTPNGSTFQVNQVS